MLTPASESDLPAVVELVNGAYRGEASRRGWTTEADYLGGQRVDFESLRTDLAANPQAMLLVLRDAPDPALLGCVWLEPHGADTWHLGMLTVRPDRQNHRLGRLLLAESEALAKARGARRIEMTVVNIRDTLIAWYERRGFVLTGETRPFPYGDERFGIPLRDDLHFIVLEKQL